ncbi:hypothetical protein PHYPSEUDO_010487 [Phytophthora pseudosyringae]|uniref:Uncharacterized protein n=1 Tax=Phytophthora pseudosyringae TaxID=221518 RepID=A0A8T1WCI5_9STRA|nr:hypothetical protein PHYPSEUDO_010487 [Phytophthora pseudosyringae]
MASTVNENNNTDIQETLVTSDNDSMCGERSSEDLDTVASTSASCSQHKSIACTDTDICGNNCNINVQEISTRSATPGPSLASASENQASIVVDKRGGVVIDAYSSTTSSGEKTPPHTLQVNPESTLPR